MRGRGRQFKQMYECIVYVCAPRPRGVTRSKNVLGMTKTRWKTIGVCVCVCVKERERERERARDGECVQQQEEGRSDRLSLPLNVSFLFEPETLSYRSRPFSPKAAANYFCKLLLKPMTSSLLKPRKEKSGRPEQSKNCFIVSFSSLLTFERRYQPRHRRCRRRHKEASLKRFSVSVITLPSKLKKSSISQFDKKTKTRSRL